MNDLDLTLSSRRTATDRRQHVRLTNTFFTDPARFAQIADPIRRMAMLAMHGASIGICDELGSDGHLLPESALQRTGLPPEFAKEMIAEGCWHQADHDCVRCPQPRAGHVYLHDYLKHNRTAEEIRRTAERRAANGASGGRSRWAGHTKPEPAPKGRRGRPRKNQPEIQIQPDGQAALVIEHPAELATRARKERADKAEAKVFEPIVLELCEELAAIVRDNGFSVGKLGPSWWKPCEQLLRIGPPNAKASVTPDQIRKAMRWANRDAFWWQQVRSMQTLRERYEQLRAAAGDPNRAKRGAAAVPGRRNAGPPPAVTVPGMSALYGRQMPARSGGDG
jgi:hypothetical protein